MSTGPGLESLVDRMRIVCPLSLSLSLSTISFMCRDNLSYYK
ncbi:hypothetical protein QQP08_021927 [Theobroma cacao]|nr:hypothetical protein QQP08_021927 [Theobroma cacao]